MAYGPGDLIIDDDYNIFATGNAAGTGDDNVANINTIWGVGTLDKGWGQSTTVSPVSTGATVTATQWATLFTRLTSISNQTGASITALTNPVAGNVIDWKSSFQGDLDNQFINRNNAAGVGSTITLNGVATRTTSWITALTATHTITFANANSARYFLQCWWTCYLGRCQNRRYWRLKEYILDQSSHSLRNTELDHWHRCPDHRWY